MTAHDPLCGLPDWAPIGDRECDCGLIARVRADERERMTLPEWTQVVADARASAEAEVRERIAQDVLDACRHWAGVDPKPCATCERIAARIARGGESDD